MTALVQGSKCAKQKVGTVTGSSALASEAEPPVLAHFPHAILHTTCLLSSVLWDISLSLSQLLSLTLPGVYISIAKGTLNCLWTKVPMYYQGLWYENLLGGCSLATAFMEKLEVWGQTEPVGMKPKWSERPSSHPPLCIAAVPQAHLQLPSSSWCTLIQHSQQHTPSRTLTQLVTCTLTAIYTCMPTLKHPTVA